MCCTPTLRWLIVLTLPPRYRCSLNRSRPLGSCPRAAGWSAATSCFDPNETSSEPKMLDAISPFVSTATNPTEKYERRRANTEGLQFLSQHMTDTGHQEGSMPEINTRFLFTLA